MLVCKQTRRRMLALNMSLWCNCPPFWVAIELPGDNGTTERPDWEEATLRDSNLLSMTKSLCRMEPTPQATEVQQHNTGTGIISFVLTAKAIVRGRQEP